MSEQSKPKRPRIKVKRPAGTSGIIIKTEEQ